MRNSVWPQPWGEGAQVSRLSPQEWVASEGEAGTSSGPSPGSWFSPYWGVSWRQAVTCRLPVWEAAWRGPHHLISGDSPGLTWLSGTCPAVRQNQLSLHPRRGRHLVPSDLCPLWHPRQSLPGTHTELRIHSFHQQILIERLLYAQRGAWRWGYGVNQVDRVPALLEPTVSWGKTDGTQINK